MNDNTKMCSVFMPIMRKLLPEILNIPVRPRLWSVFPGIILYLAFPRAESLKPPRRELESQVAVQKISFSGLVMLRVRHGAFM